MKAITLFVILVVCIASVYSGILEPRHKEELKKIRNSCVVESGLSPYEIVSLIRAARPADKLIDASKCIVNKIVVLQKENQVVGEIVDRTVQAIQNTDVSEIIGNAIRTCENLLGEQTCDKILDLAGTLFETAQKLTAQLG